MKSLCRLCSLEDNIHNLHDVFSTKVRGSKDLLVDILYWTFSVEIVATDEYPKAVCTDCKVLIEYVLEIRSAFQRNQDYILKKYSGEQQVPITAETISTVNHNRERDKIPIEIVSSDDEEEMYAEAENQSEIVKVKVADLEEMCPSVVIKPFETSEEYMWYKPVGFGRFIKRKYRHFRFDDHLLEDICGFMGTDDKVKSYKKSCKVNAIKENQSGSTLQSDEVTLDATASAPKVWLEPVEYLMARENYKEISTLHCPKNPLVKSYRVLSLNDNSTDTMHKLSNMRKLWVCDYCSKSFLHQTSLREHYNLKHGLVLSEKKQIHKKRKSSTSDITEKSSVSDSCSEDDSGSCGQKRFRSSKTRSSVSSPSSRICSNDSLDSEDITNGTSAEMTYVWERKKLGVYKATTFCNIKTGSADELDSKQINLDKTIRKLADRLEEIVQS